MSNKFLNVKFGADTTGFKKGTNEVRAELTELNSAMRTNRREQKELNDEIKKLEKQQKELKTVMAQVKTPTKEMTDEADRLQKALDEAALKAAKLKTEEQELKGKVSATTKELNEQNTATEKNALSVEKVGKALKTAVTMTATSMAALFTYTAKMAASAGDIDDMSKKIGISVEDVQKLMYAAELSGTSYETLTGTYSKLIKNMDAASKGTGTAYEGFTALGISVTKANGELRDHNEVFSEVIDALGKVGNETERDAIALSILGKSALELNPLIEGGKDMLNEFSNELERQGVILNQTQLDKLLEFDDKLVKFKSTFQAKMMESSVDWVDAFDELLDKSDEIVDLVATLITGFAKITGFIVDHKEAVLALAIAYGTMKGAMSIKTLISSVITTVKSLTVATNGATTAQIAFNAAAQAMPYIALVSVMIMLISEFSKYRKLASEVNDETTLFNQIMKETRTSIDETVRETQNEVDVLKQKADRYEELRQKTKLTADEERELYNIASEFEAKYPNQISLIDTKTNSYKEMGKQLDELTQKMLINAQVAATEEALTQKYSEKYTAEQNLETAEANLAEVQEKDYIKSRTVSQVFTDAIKDVVSPFGGQSSSAMQRYREDLGNASTEVEKYKNELSAINAVIAEIESELKSIYGTSNADKLGDKTEDIKNLAAAVSALEEEYTLLSSAEKELKDTQELSSETLNSITSKYPSLLGVVNDYLSGIASGEDVIKRLSLAYEMDVENNADAFRQKLDTDTEYYQKLQQMNNTYINELATEYGVDLSNYHNYAEAKLAIEETFLTKKAKNWADYYDAESKRWVGSIKNITAYAKQLKSQGYSDEDINLIVNQKQQDYMDTVNAVGALSNLNFSSDLADYSEYYYNNLQSTDDNNGGNSNSSDSTSTQKETSVYEQAKASYAKLVNDRIEEIKKLTEAETAGADERIAAINAEIDARKKLTETEDLQKRIDFIKGQLEYSQLDEFERYELTKQLSALEKEQTDTAWEEGKKAEIAAIEAEKAALKQASDAQTTELQNRINYSNTLFTDLANGYKAATTIANNNSKTANIQIVEKALTKGQVTQIIREALGIEEVF